MLCLLQWPPIFTFYTYLKFHITCVLWAHRSIKLSASVVGVILDIQYAVNNMQLMASQYFFLFAPRTLQVYLFFTFTQSFSVACHGYCIFLAYQTDKTGVESISLCLPKFSMHATNTNFWPDFHFPPQNAELCMPLLVPLCYLCSRHQHCTYKTVSFVIKM